MSNCIELSGNFTKTLGAKDIDIPALKAFVDSVRDLPKSPSSGDEAMAWWFLSAAEFRPSLAFVTIPFGESRSSHTWRDFKGTLLTLSKFALRPITLNFRLRDTDWDNNSKPESAKFVLLPGGKVLGI